MNEVNVLVFRTSSSLTVASDGCFVTSCLAPEMCDSSDLVVFFEP